MLAAVVAAVILTRPTRSAPPGAKPAAHIEQLQNTVAALPHASVGPYCLGAIGSTALQLHFRRATELPDDFRRADELVLASAPRSGSTWLAVTLERVAHYRHVHTTHAPFVERAEHPRLDGRDAMLLVRNPFDSYRSYQHSLDELNRIRHHTTKAFPQLTLDEFIERWARHNDYWRNEENVSVVHYEHLLGDPVEALGRSFGLSADLALAERARSESILAPPRLNRSQRRCGRALDGLFSDASSGTASSATVNATTASVAALKRMVAKHSLARYGYTVVQSDAEWHRDG